MLPFESGYQDGQNRRALQQERAYQGKPTSTPGPTTGGDTTGISTNSPIPMSGPYLMAQAQAQAAYQAALAATNAKRGQLWKQYGFTGDINAKTGGFSHLRVDPYSMYGQLQQMHQAQGHEFDQAFQNADNRDIGHIGLGAQDVSALRYAHGAQDTQFGNQFLGANQDLTAALQQAAFDRDNAILNAKWSAATDAVNQGNFDPAPAAASTPASAPAAAGVSWGGRNFTTRAGLAKWLTAHGSTYAGWAQNHPSAAKKLK
jgi:hypothetical protein